MAVSTHQQRVDPEPIRDEYLVFRRWMTSDGVPRFSNFVRWACKEAVTDFGDVVAGLARGLPLLLLATVFLLMQAELWQVAFLTEWPEFAAIVVIMATLGVGAMLVSSKQQLAEIRRMPDWDAVASAVADEDDRDLKEVLQQLKTDDVPVPEPELRGACRLRAVLVVAVYQAIIFLPLALFAGLICWGISELAVPTEVAGEWIYGDDATREQIAKVKAPGPFAEPWPRVALVLAAFCFMYLTVKIPTDHELREEFLESSERGVSRWIARLLLHRAVANALKVGR